MKSCNIWTISPLTFFPQRRFCKGKEMKNQALIAKKFSQCMQFEIELDGIQTLQQQFSGVVLLFPKTCIVLAWIKENGNSTMKIDYNNVTLIRFRFHSYLDSSVTMQAPFKKLATLYSIKIPQDFQQWLLPFARHLKNWWSLHVTVMSLGETTVISNDWPSACHFYWRHFY